MKATYSIDASSLRLVCCPQKFINTVVRGLRKHGEKAFKPAFGIAYHKYKAEYLTHGDHSKAMMAGQQYYNKITSAPKSGNWEPSNLTTVMLKDKNIPTPYSVLNDADGKPLVEVKFSIPIYENDDCIINLAGTIDVLATYCGCKAFGDHKVTESWKQEEFMGKYILDHQMMVYSYVLNKLAEFHPDTFGSFKNAPCFINMIQLKASGPEFFTSPLISFSKEHMIDIQELLANAINLILAYNAGEYILRDYSQCGVYGLCPFFELCSQDRVDEEFTITYNYKTKPYDPMKFDED